MKEHHETPQLGVRIRGLLKTHSITQTALAERTGIDRADLNRLINGRRGPRADEIRWLAEVFKMTPAELVAGVELPARAEESLAAFADLEARAADGQQRAEMAEAKLAQLESTAEEERQANMHARLEADKAHRAEQSRLREAHYNELVQVRQDHYSQVQEMQKVSEQGEAQAFQAMQEMHAEIQRLRTQLTQFKTALVTTQHQNVELRNQLASQAGTAAATALFGGIAGMLLGASLASD